MNRLISELVNYGLQKNLVHADDKTYVINQLIELFGKSEFQWVDAETRPLSEILDDMNDYAAGLRHRLEFIEVFDENFNPI